MKPMTMVIMMGKLGYNNKKQKNLMIIMLCDNAAATAYLHNHEGDKNDACVYA